MDSAFEPTQPEAQSRNNFHLDNQNKGRFNLNKPRIQQAAALTRPWRKMSAEPNYFARLVTGESSPDQIHKDLLANFALNCSITALNLQLAGRADAAQIKESLIASWRASVEAKFAKEVDELRKKAGTPLGGIVSGALGDHGDLEEIVARRQKAMDSIESVARTSILPKDSPISTQKP